MSSHLTRFTLGQGARPARPAAKASHTGYALMTGGASRAIWDCRRPETVKAVNGRNEETRVDPGGRRLFRKRSGYAGHKVTGDS